ncbi:hypothetical protein EIZ62_25335 [Streptomyces ficellus]|uniref:Uncharacterized protein n=1 Tax=Streptomyces ficellus TaxID=1977088 RepID=A0A6I6FDF9_9ACTN|nr:hypothetical protein EIZ62_25335 [Streptomyces ficellus]
MAGRGGRRPGRYPAPGPYRARRTAPCPYRARWAAGDGRGAARCGGRRRPGRLPALGRTPPFPYRAPNGRPGRGRGAAGRRGRSPSVSPPRGGRPER